jgi:hypothetical protein
VARLGWLAEGVSSIDGVLLLAVALQHAGCWPMGGWGGGTSLYTCGQAKASLDDMGLIFILGLGP